MRRTRVEQNIIDRAIAFIDPVRARKRFMARAQMALAGQWIGGRTDRRATKDWLPAAGSADDDTLDDLPALRTRSRDLQRHNPIALGAINTNVTSIIGTGLALRSRPDAKALRMTPEQAQEWRETTEREFRMWAENPIACDLEQTLDFYGLQALGLRSCLESGDVLAVLPMQRTEGSPYRLKVQMVEADRLSNKDGAADNQRLVAGVEKNAYGAPIAYHIAKRHPGDIRSVTREWDVIPAFGSRTRRRNVIHLYTKSRPGQTRGVPYLAPVIEMLKQISDYTHAELQAAVVASMFTVFIETERGQGLDLDEDGSSPTTAPVSGSDIKLGAGAIIDLAKGEKMTFANPGRPNSAADVFLQLMTRQVGMALELPYEVLVKHFTASYSAARAALLEAWRFFRGRRAWVASMFCQPIYEAWLEEAVALGRIVAPGYFDDPAIRMAYAGAEWIGDAPGQIDPLKEIDAAIKRIDAKLSTRTDEAMELRGADWMEIVERLAMEQRLIEANGMQVAMPQDQPTQSGAPSRSPYPSDEPPDDPGEDEDGGQPNGEDPEND